MEFKINSLEYDFRVKKMNAIDALALKNVIDFDNFDATKNCFKIILEQLEVKCDNTWLPVKELGKDIYFPKGIEDNVFAIKELIEAFLNDYFKPLFRNPTH